jgi:site-specific DNA-methyltransferase (adenine-specific)
MSNALAVLPAPTPAKAGARAAVEAETPTITPGEAGIRAAWYEAQPKTLPVDTVILGDCQKVLRWLPDASIDMVLTDPPYLVRYTDRGGRSIMNDDNGRWIFPAFAEIFRVMKPDTFCVSFYGWSKLARFLTAWREIGFRPFGHFVWVKRYASCTRHTRMKHEQAYLLAKGNPPMPKDPPADVLEWAYTGNRLHPTQKPVSGLVPLIRAFTKPGAIVLDPFAGSGTTGVAARQCNRRYLLIEQDATYYRTAEARLDPQVPARLI